MAKVGILMGSESDRGVVEQAIPYLEYFGIISDIRVMSAHRTPTVVQEFSASAESNGFDIIIACAGMAAHLPGVVAAFTSLPVIGVPLAAGHLNGMDSLLSILQMPAGVPVATMAVGKAGMKNAAIFSAQIISRFDNKVKERFRKFKENQCKIPQ
jgi:5-(carboxyamino)imidazole ribonucleotide mutase